MEDRELFIASSKIRNVLAPATLNAAGVLARADRAVVARGRAYYQQFWRVRLEHLDEQEATVSVQGSRRYKVEVWLEDDGEVVLLCNCPYAVNAPRVVCKHKVAAVLFLENHLRHNAPPTWESVLTKAVRPVAARTAQSKPAELLFFSLQQRGASWAVVPYTVAAGFFPDTSSLHDRAATARIVSEKRLSSQAEKISPYATSGDARAYANVTRRQSSLVKLLVSSGLYYGQIYNGAALDFDTLFALLEGAPLFYGTDKNPLQRTLDINHETARIEMEMSQIADGLHLRPVAVLPGERVFPLGEQETKLISYKPLWILASDQLFHLDAPHDVFTLFQQGNGVKVPHDEEGVFLEKYLTTLAERFPLRGEAVKWEEVRDALPVPRLYLTEDESELRVQLRFGYSDYEVTAARHPPQQSIRRNALTGVLVRIARQREMEEARWNELGAATFGLKRNASAKDTFTLRSKIHPFDFLLRYVPQLVAAGYEIYGEEELKLARINRHRPTISFGVTSGIDWFDVKTVINFGEIEVSLAEIRKTLRKRERFIKLADGSIGEIPPEWIERYRHLFALSEETDKGLRVANHHLTLLDQLLAGDERARTDKEFERRREQLRNFSGIKAQKLPKHFTGELRPYQKAGFDWLYFLREYNFGGCLADDMGTGKCIAADSLVAHNGILRTAEQIWASHAKDVCFDGEGYWAVPREPLLVASLDEQTGRIMEAPVKRLYRQRVCEKMRVVRLADGSSITITDRHRLLTPNGWTRDLHVGDYVCVPARLPSATNHENEDLIKFLAWQIAEGYEQTNRATVSITQKDETSKWTTQTLNACATFDRQQLTSTRERLQQLCEREVFYCKIASIEIIEYDGWVYDFEIPTHHNFVANNILCHNTIQTLVFLQSLKERGQAKQASLLVVPRSLLFNWEREATRFTPRLRLLNHAMAERTQDVTDFDDTDVVLTTYGVLLRDIEMLMHYEFNYLILDEAQAIKNPLAETAKAARLLRGRHRLTLTGTPVENNTLELWSQFAFLNPGLLGNADYFREEFATPIERKGDEAAAQFLRKMVYPFILRRTKDQVAKDLPPRTTRQLVCEMEPQQRKLYNEKRDYYRALLLKMIEEEGVNNARFKVLEGLLRLRQICNHPRLVVPNFKGASAKFDLLMETLTTLHAEGHKALVFSQFVKMLKLIQTELKKRHVPFSYLDGQTKDRQARVDAFQGDAEIPFFLISLRAGGVGLNLTAADYVIHVDPWWNPAVEMQATDRTHRIGQDKPVFVYKLIVRDSVEEKILQLQERKRQLVTQLISTESSFFKSLTPDDIRTLFS